MRRKKQKEFYTMNIFYIDYENVSSQGLKGVELLQDSDVVNLLYSKKADNVKIDMLSMLMESKATIHFLPVHVGTPNALDFQLVTLLFLNYKEGNRYYIISKDSGYDCCIKTAAENGAPDIARFPNIESALKGSASKKTRRGKRNTKDTTAETASSATASSGNTSAGNGNAGSADSGNRNSGSIGSGNESAGSGNINNSSADSGTRNSGSAGSGSGNSGPAGSGNNGSGAAGKKQNRKASASGAQSQTQTVSNTSNIPAPSSPVRNDSEQVPAGEAPEEAQGKASEEEQPKKKTSRRRGRRKSAQGEASEAVQTITEQSGPLTQENNNSQPADGTDIMNAPAESKGKKVEARPNENHTSSPAASRIDPDKPVSILSVIRRRNDVQLDLHQIDLIREALKSSQNKQQFYNYFVKKLGQKPGIELYHSIKSSYTDLINAKLL